MNGHLAVCLAGQVYVWNSANGEIQQLMEMEGPDEYVSSVSWINEGNYLAIGTSTSDVQVISTLGENIRIIPVLLSSCMS